jgi:4-amino-4-deoxy-L-arabinose transferase-like glycosyltransferase
VSAETTVVTGFLRQQENAATAQEQSDPADPPASTVEPQEQRGWRWWILLGLAVGFVLQVGWRLWLIRDAYTPIAHADEDRYLLAARALAGGPGGLAGDTAAFRRMGYPLILSPIYWFTSDPFHVYRAAQIFGALLNALTFPLAYLFGRRVLQSSRWPALALAFVAATLPAVVYYSEFTLTDVLFGPIGLSWLLLIHGWFANRTKAGRATAGILAGLLVGYAFTIHVRGLVMLGIFVALIAVAVFRERARWKVALASIAGALAMTIVDFAAQRAVADKMLYGGVEPGNRLVDRLTSAGSFVQAVCDAIGQLWYTSAATWGLGAIGLVVAVERIRGRTGKVESSDATGRSSRVDWPQRMTLAVAIVTAAAIALSSAAALPDDMRVSNHAYFRYVAWLAPIWVVIGGLALIGAGYRNAWRLIMRGGALSVGALVVVLSQLRANEAFEPFDTPEVSFLTGNWRHFLPARAELVVLIFLVVVGLGLASRQKGFPRLTAAALAGVLLLNLASMAVVNYNLVRPMALGQYRGVAGRLVEGMKIDEHDVVVSSQWVALGAMLNNQREVYWAPMRYFDHRAGEQPPADATVVIGPWHSRNKDDYDGTADGWRRISGDTLQQYAVWLRADDPRHNGAPPIGQGS